MQPWYYALPWLVISYEPPGKPSYGASDCDTLNGVPAPRTRLGENSCENAGQENGRIGRLENLKFLLLVFGVFKHPFIFKTLQNYVVCAC